MVYSFSLNCSNQSIFSFKFCHWTVCENQTNKRAMSTGTDIFLWKCWESTMLCVLTFHTTSCSPCIYKYYRFITKAKQEHCWMHRMLLFISYKFVKGFLTIAFSLLVFLTETFMMCVNVFYITRNKISAWSDKNEKFPHRPPL